MIRFVLRPAPALALALLVAGCVAPGGPSTTEPAAEKPMKQHEAGLERVLGKNARDLVALFGDADLDGHEGEARRMQFVSPVCVLDAYLYPEKDGGDLVVSYVDARLPNGNDVDRASCVAALSRRAAAP